MCLRNFIVVYLFYRYSQELLNTEIIKYLGLKHRMGVFFLLKSLFKQYKQSHIPTMFLIHGIFS